jgi:hypothetical protein
LDPENTALPTGDTAAAGEQAQTAAATDPVIEAGQQQEGQEATPDNGEKPDATEGDDKPEGGKKEKTPERREIDRLRRRVDNLTRRRYESEAQRGQEPQQRQQQGTQASDDEPVTLSRAELQKLITEQAQQLAPVVGEQAAEIERRKGVVASLAKQWGQEEFNAKADDLDAAFGGLADRSGRPKPATDAIFEADDPKAVIEYLTDPDNADEAERIARLPAGRAARAVTLLEVKLKEAKANAKPKPSTAARPLEAVKGGGVPAGMPNPADTKAYVKWANEQERAARR